MKVVQASKMFKEKGSKTTLNLEEATSEADAVRFLNKVFDISFAQSVWRYILAYGVPTAVVNKILAGVPKKEHYNVLQKNIVFKKDDGGNALFHKHDIVGLDTVLIRALGLVIEAPAPAPPADDDHRVGDAAGTPAAKEKEAAAEEATIITPPPKDTTAKRQRNQ